ncbi:nucleolar protein 8 [Manacus vitellinus]|uniref:nucleolar protein 8 n=1 Tax=Manacus vitellinus TaxID=328815 RepID=UPI00115E8F4E|nr:nucleolar protein 8 [Manacus vitellinus]
MQAIKMQNVKLMHVRMGRQAFWKIRSFVFMLLPQRDLQEINRCRTTRGGWRLWRRGTGRENCRRNSSKELFQTCQAAGKHKHIVFDSDVENEAEVGETLKKDGSLGNMHGEDKSAPKASGKLFDSSEDEQDDTDDERFKIKPQFEGKAGEKLLKLQSRFGTDERFRMDARFLESDSEEEEGKPGHISWG